MIDALYIVFVKLISMVVMFVMVYQFGSYPIKTHTLINADLLSYTAAFSGGLFLSVGLIHMLPEADADIQQYFNDGLEHFPFAYLFTILGFTIILWIEKVAFRKTKNQIQDVELETFNQAEPLLDQLPQRNSFTFPKQNEIITSINQAYPINFQPYIMSLAIGIHSVFEGLAIGIEDQLPELLTISLAVICHKWAEGWTLGVAFKKSTSSEEDSLRMIMLQAALNPLGIGLGWILRSKGFFISGIFQSISAGTFLYIATVHVIVEEFNMKEKKIQKFLIYVIAIAFISVITLFE